MNAHIDNLKNTGTGGGVELPPLNLHTDSTGAGPVTPGVESTNAPAETVAWNNAPAETPWDGANHPYAAMAAPGAPAIVASSGGDGHMAEILPNVTVGGAGPAEIPAPVQQAIANGTPIRFSSAGENQGAQPPREPDFFLNTDGTMVANPKATPSPDGSINIQLQAEQQANQKSLTDAIKAESENQKLTAKDLISGFQRAHPGEPVPSWMTDLMNAQPNIPDFVPFPTPANQPREQAAPPPENGFVPRGVGGGGGGGGSGGGGGGGGDSGFAGNGGFDSQGYFKGSPGGNDGTLQTGGKDSHGAPLGAGEQVQAQQLYNYFKDHGFSDAQASGILGNMQTESSFKTDAYNKGEGAIGLCQWEGGRRTELEHFAKSEGKPVTDWHVQADFIMFEMKGDPAQGGGKEHNAYNALMSAHTPEQAAVAFQSKYERSAGLTNRATNADHLYASLDHTAPHTPTTTPTETRNA